jgi:SpoVK/Ycf46/Vps4 family AAA+-type ATPase
MTRLIIFYYNNSGADLSALVREASEFALKEFIKNPTPENEIVRLRHFEFAFKKIKPSVSLKVIILK